VVLANRDGRCRPGLFVSGRVFVEDADVAVGVPNDAILLVDGKPSVFVGGKGEFRLRPVTRGRSDTGSTEIVGGLVPGEVYVSQGAFTLKSELDKPAPEE
jgi:cobalt-zinc-cadmium efflux system membrane fusion protein